MSNCVKITDLEHLPVEKTLLVHYNILCTGVWHLSQLLTAYRNVCDTEWTVMYPNHQHPRHSDFPIAVPVPGRPAIFAWNYGGIQGISGENFDNNHSYLVQLSLFEYGCLYTGSGISPTGSTGSPPLPTGIFIIDPIIGRSGDRSGSTPSLPAPITPPVPRPAPPAPPDPPGNGRQYRPVPIVPPGWVFNPTGTGVIDPTGGCCVPPYIPTPPVGVDGGGSNYINIPGVGIPPVLVYNPPVQPTDPPDSSYVYNPVVPQPPDSVWDNISIENEGSAGILGGSFNGLNIGTLSNNQQVFKEWSRPSNLGLGQTKTDLTVNPLDRSSAISSIPSVSNKTVNKFGKGVDLGVSSDDSDVGDTPGSLSSKLKSSIRGTDLSKLISLNQINTSSVMPGCLVDLQIGFDDIPYGEPVIASSVFYPPAGIQLSVTASLYALDSDGKVFLLQATQNSSCSFESPVALGVSQSSTMFKPGSVVILFLVYNDSDNVIGIASRRVGIRSTSFRNNAAPVSNTSVQNSMLLDYDKTHSSLLNLGAAKLSENYTSLLFPNSNKTYSIIVQKVTGQPDGTLSASVISNQNVDYSMEGYLLDSSFKPYQNPNTSAYVPYVFSGQKVFSAKGKIILDGEPVLSDSHVVGVLDVDLSAAPIEYAVLPEVSRGIILLISPLDVVSNSTARLHLSTDYRLSPATSSVVGSTVDVTVPYAMERVALVINGQTSGEVPDNYTQLIGITNQSGRAIFSGVSIQDGDYYSVVLEGNGSFNPYRYTIYTTQYIT